MDGLLCLYWEYLQNAPQLEAEPLKIMAMWLPGNAA